ncbi:MAG: pyrimidine-nucleoside phosphorylase [Lachnospiraceae bacterium]|nr:pyrimidine-nucleoside phosphorylase [Lachnospiraceae bacterium]
MRMYDLINKKKNGSELTSAEIDFMVCGFTDGIIPDYQMSAMMMAIFFRGMSEKETLALTNAMAKSGAMLDLSAIDGIKVDKHSTGGVGDKTSLALAPLVSACGLKVAKMSGRGLGHTGGTIDKLESFPGFTTEISVDEFVKNVNEIGMAIMGQTNELAPADKRLYALRDVTATVDQMSLIASSIMSKKLAAGADAIVLDVKTGSGAFMKDEKDAVLLAEEMQRIGTNAGRKTVALVTDMDQPLGFAVGNALEVKEAIETLKGNGPEDFVKLCVALGAQMLLVGGLALNQNEAEAKIRAAINDGSALKVMADFVKAQGGDPDFVYQPEKLPAANIITPVFAPESGYIEKIICDEIGHCSLILGGGRVTKDSIIDLSVGIVLSKKIGDPVSKGELLANIHGNDEAKIAAAKARLLGAYKISKSPVKPPVLIKKNIGQEFI